MEKLNCRVKLIYSARVFRLIITHQRRSPVESFTVLFALIEYLCETQINERIVIKRKTSDNIYGNVIIGAAVGGIPEVCINEYNGLLFEKENVVQLSSILEKLLLNKTLRSIYSSNSIKLSYKFNRMNSVQNLISEYNNLLRQ